LTAGRPGLGEEAANSVTRAAGVVFYACRSLPYAHAIWHGFVLAGSALHFAAVLLCVARA
jgi:hemolysin III